MSGVPTTAPFHVLILDNESFQAGDVDTGFIVKHADTLTVRRRRRRCTSVSPARPPGLAPAACKATAASCMHGRRGALSAERGLPAMLCRSPPR